MTAPRILMSCDAVGGVWQYSIDLCRALATHGADICLAVLGPPASAHQRAQAGEIDRLVVVETGDELDWTARAANDVEAAAAHLATLAMAHGADIVHLNSPALAAEVDFPAPVVTVTHSCVGTWWTAVRDGPLPEDLAWRDDLHRAGLQKADLVIAPSRSFAAATADRHGLGLVPRVIHNGRSALDVAERPMHDFVFTAGRLWDEGKNVATLDRVAARLAIPFRAAGACVGPSGDMVAPHHLATLGQLDAAALSRQLACRPIFVSAALYEPFGLAVLEAAAAGCPLVLSDIPTFREIWGDAALFVDPCDDAGFAQAIEDLIGDMPSRIERGERARARSLRYSAAAMGEATLAAYGQLLSRPAARACRSALA